MCRIKVQDTYSGVPCALRNYLRKRGAKFCGHRMSEQDCELAFLNWVAYEMDLPSNVQDGSFDCPMSSCNERGFKDMKSFLDHVRNCEWLSEANYQCPQHGQEHFGLYEKDPKLRKAFDFSKVLGFIKRKDPSGDGVYQMSNLVCQGALESREMPKSRSDTMTNQGLEDTYLYSGDTDHHKFSQGAKTDITASQELEGSGRILCEMEANMPGRQNIPELGDTGAEITGAFSWADAENGTLELDSTSLKELRLSTQTAAPSAIDITEESHNAAYSNNAEAVTLPQAYAAARIEDWMFQSLPDKPVKEKSVSLNCNDTEVNTLVSPVSPTTSRSEIHGLVSPISPTSSQSAIDHSPALAGPYISLDDNTKPDQPVREFPDWYVSVQYSPDHNGAPQSESFWHRNSATTYTHDDVHRRNHQQTSVAPSVSRLLQSSRATEPCCSNINRLAMVYSPPLEPNSLAEESLQIPFASGDAPTSEPGLQSRADLPERWAPSTQRYIERLDHLVCMLDTRWQEYLKKCPDLYILSSEARFGSPFEAALQALRDCFSGQRLSKIQDIIPLAYLVYACAHVCHYYDPAYSLDDLYKNIRQWSTSISDTQDQQRFLKMADVSWSTLHTVSDLETELQSTNFGQTDQLSQEESLRLYIPKACVVVSQHSCLKPMTGETLNIDQHTDFRAGLVAETCARVLDDFAYSVILERFNTVADSLRNQSNATIIRPEVSKVIDPLLKQSKYSPFHRIIENTRNFFELGSLRNIREVEVFLLAGYRHSCHFGRNYRDYRKEVTFLCNRAVDLQESSWRNGYYATHIDHMELIWLRLGKRPQYSFNHTPLSDRYGQINPFANDACATPTSAISRWSASTSTTLVSNPSSMTRMSSNTSNGGTLWTGSSDISPVSSTPSSLLSPDHLQSHMLAAAQKVTRCPKCDQPFSGSSQNSRSNLKRHMRDTHHEGGQIACIEPECGEKFGRADNLRIHQKKAHNIESSVKKPRSKLQRRLGKERARLQVNHV